MALASKVYKSRVCVTGGFDYTFGSEGPEWKVWYSPAAEHYDVLRCWETGNQDHDAGKGGTVSAEAGESLTVDVAMVGTGAKRETVPEERYGRRAHLSGAKKHVAMAIDVAGCGEALVDAMDGGVVTLLVQEHQLAGPSLLGSPSAAMGTGWHGIGDPAFANGNGRSGGTAVLTRRPTERVCGDTLARGTIAIVSWTRRNRTHTGSKHNAQAADPTQPEATAQMFRE